MKGKNTLLIKNLHVEINGKQILKGLSLTIEEGEIHALMGPNGSGKSTLCNVLMGHPKYKVTKGSAKFNNKEILEMEPDERAKLGIFMAFQSPPEIPGVPLGNFLRNSKKAVTGKNIDPKTFLNEIKEKIALMKMDEKFIGRSINEGFSGGEKKRAEIIQMSTLEPKLALLDEIDSGLDIDALRTVTDGIKLIHKKTNPGILLVTHYQRILDYIKPDFVHIMSNGKIVKSGDKNLAKKLEKEGYKKYID